MKKWLLNIFYFLIPLILLLLPACYVLYSSKENFHNIDKAIRNPDNKKYLMGYLYNEENYRYIKYKNLLERKATVVALGSSRVLPFRKEMFEAEFFNAGFAIENVTDFQVFLSCIPDDHLPDYLIIGLDQWMFNDAWNDLTVPAKSRWTRNNSSNAGEGLKKVLDVYPDLIKGKLRLSKPVRTYDDHIEGIGLNATVHSTGFRNDGSCYYGELVQKLARRDTSISDYDFRNSFKRIREGNERFQYGDQVSPRAVIVLDQLLRFCKSKGIQVIGFIPPFADAVYTKMKNSGNYEYVEKLYPALKPVFARYDFELYGYKTVTACGSNDFQTTDGFHGGENTYLRIIIDMLKNKSVLNKISNLEKHEQELAATDNNYIVYPY